MSANTTPLPNLPAPNPPLPNLPCPSCGTNLLQEGFYNSCTETQRLREDNYTQMVNGKLYIDHNEDNYETIDHECDFEAFCHGCDALLPWPLFRIRHLDGTPLSLAGGAIARLVAEVEGKAPAATT